MAIVNSRAAIEPKTGKAAIFVNETIHSLMRKLFSNGEQGFFYDTNDLSTMFQDAAGTVPVTGVGQAVGLIRDKSGRNNHAYQTTSAARPLLKQVPILGNELVVNGDFSNGTVGWGTAGSGTPNWGISLGAATAALSNSASRYLIYLAGGTVAGKSYYVSFDVSGSNGTGGVRFGNGTDNSSAWFTGNGKVGFILTAGGATPNNLWFQANANWSGSVDNLSVKEITGYRTDRNYIEYDGVDDKLITNLPAQLTGCTVVRAVPNFGTQILTNQTIPTTYNDNTDHCGLIVINRALTATETSQITKLFNKTAGVTLSV